MQDPLNFIIYLRLRPAAKNSYNWVVEMINELLETELCGVMLEKGGRCGHCLGSTISIHLLHGKNEFVCLEENEQVHHYGRVSEHAFHDEIYKLFMNIVRQEHVEVKLGSGLLIGREDG
jgi:hypothetical protein